MQRPSASAQNHLKDVAELECHSAYLPVDLFNIIF
jgi:hypothetical protein